MSLEASSEEACFASNAKPTIANRWIHRLGERVGAYCQVVAISAPRGRKRGPVTYIAVSEKHDHHCAMGQRRLVRGIEW